MSVVASFLAFAVVGQGKVEFAQIEENKYKAFTELKDFEGRYDVVTLPTNGEGGRQQVTISLSGTSRRIRVVSNGAPVVESAWNKDRKWLVNHLVKQYTDERKAGAFLLVDPYKPLPVQKGRMNFTVADMGPRFNTDPSPKIVSDEMITESGKKVRRIEAVTNNEAQKGEVRIVQVFDEGTWIVRRFLMEVKSDGKVLLKISGFLRGDKKGAVPAARFELPVSDLGGYQKIGDLF